MADPAQSFNTGFQTGIQQAESEKSRAVSMSQLAENKRQFDVVNDLRNQQFELQKQQVGVALDGAKTQNRIQELALDQARVEQEYAPQYAEWGAALSRTPVDQLASFKFPPLPKGGTFKQQQAAMGMLQDALASANKNVAAMTQLKNQQEDLEQAREAYAAGFLDVYNSDGSINTQALMNATQEQNTAKTLALAKRYNFDPTQGGFTPETIYDRRGRLTEDGKNLLASFDKQRQQELQGQIGLTEATIKARAANANKSLTEAQGNALVYSERMGLNRDIIDSLEQFNPASIAGTVSRKVSNSELTNWLSSEDGQRYIAAKKNWISAALRKESGAAISKSEYEEADKEYFPQLGDSSKTIADKVARRSIYENSMRKASGQQAQGMMTTQERPASNQATFKVGEVRRQNGINYQFNGSNWVEVK